uniref:Uncharacterized protein n=1 Tax=Amphimedon queenslandica TaxID=400682 RepID=A0A1X7VRH8_AMPQE
KILLLLYAEPSPRAAALHITAEAFTAPGAAEEEYDNEEPLITPATSNTIVVEPEDLKLDERAVEICKKLFLFIYSIRNGTYKNLRHFLQNGMKPKVHGKTGRIPCHALSVEGIKDVVAFLENYGEDYTILLPGRIPKSEGLRKGQAIAI